MILGKRMTFILMRLSQRRVVNYGMIYQLNLKKYSHFNPLNTNLKTIYCSL